MRLTTTTFLTCLFFLSHADGFGHSVGGPFDPAMTYNHAEWVYDWFAPRTVEANQFIRVLLMISAFASIFDNGATIVLAILLGQHVFTTITMFISE
jgi:hypothetical protein